MDGVFAGLDGASRTVVGAGLADSGRMGLAMIGFSLGVSSMGIEATESVEVVAAAELGTFSFLFCFIVG